MEIEFFYEFASTYSYPAAMTVESMAREHGVTLRFRPFLLGPVFAALGMKDSPFNLFPVKGAYMWRDLERICADLGLAFKRPSIFPQRSLLAARVAHLAADEGWAGPFSRLVYEANFAEDRDIGDEQVIRELITRAGQPADETFARATAEERKPLLRAQTERAIKLGIFGAPSFVVGSELFWGHDRMHQAFAWASRG
jgi:2-hydroxychromene-2-carboxylate isomerase